MDRTEYWTLYRAAFKHVALSEHETNVISQLYKEEGREKIFAHAKKKKIIPGCASLFTKLNIDKKYWKPIADSYRERNEKIVKCLDTVYQTLTNSGATRVAVVENFGALLYSEQDLAMFGSGDADNFADINQKDAIDKTFKNLGFQISENKAGSLLVSSVYRNEDFFPDGFYFGINWDVTNRLNLPCLTSKSEFARWEEVSLYKDTAIRLPSAETLMYICLMHVSVHGFCKSPDIRLYYDIANVAAKPLNWNQIKRWAEFDNNCLRISTAATLANTMLGVDVPDEILTLGNDRRRKRLLNLVSDKDHIILNDFPNKLTALGIDVFSCDSGILEGLGYVFFPDSEWVRKKYGSLMAGRVKHILALL